MDMLTHIVSSAGVVFGPILLLVSIGLVSLIVLLTLDLRLATALPPAFVEKFISAVGRQQFKLAYELCRADGSCLARVLAAGMGRLQYGLDDARQAAGNMLDSVRAGKEQLINYLGTIGTLGPMIGLVGTVFGMIQSFMELSKGGTPRSEELASGISHAAGGDAVGRCHLGAGDLLLHVFPQPSGADHHGCRQPGRRFADADPSPRPSARDSGGAARP